MLALFVCIFCITLCVSGVQIVTSHIRDPREKTWLILPLCIIIMLGCVHAVGSTVLGGFDMYQINHPDTTYESRMINQEEEMLMLCEDWAKDNNVEVIGNELDEFVDNNPGVNWKIGWQYWTYKIEQYHHQRLADIKLNLWHTIYYWPVR